jgi:excisionase family DNA binding protein
MQQLLLTIDETASLFGLSSWTIRYFVRVGTLPSIKVGRRVLIERAAIDTLIANRRGKAQ